MTERTVDEAANSEPAPAVAEKKAGKGSLLWREIRGMGVVIIAVLLFHSFIAKPFYIPSESMMPTLLTGDRLVVTKYPYGWSFVSPTIPNPAAIVRTLSGGPAEPWGITLPFMNGRVMGRLPARGDIVIVTPPGHDEDYIKRVIGLPGDTIEMKDGRLSINGKPVVSKVMPPADIPVDANAPCDPFQFYGRRVERGGQAYCELPVVRETLPNGVTYDTIDDGQTPGDNTGPIKIPADHVFLMGDNRDHSADSRYSLEQKGLGGPVRWENIGGRAEFITFSLDGTTSLRHPSTLLSSFRDGRAGTSLRGKRD